MAIVDVGIGHAPLPAMRISFELHGHGLAHRALRAIGSEDIVETFLAVGCVDPRCGSVTGFLQADQRIAPSDRRSQIPPTAQPLRFLCPPAATTAENCNDEAEPRNQSVRGIGRWRETGSADFQAIGQQLGGDVAGFPEYRGCANSCRPPWRAVPVRPCGR